MNLCHLVDRIVSQMTFPETTKKYCLSPLLLGSLLPNSSSEIVWLQVEKLQQRWLGNRTECRLTGTLVDLEGSSHIAPHLGAVAVHVAVGSSVCAASFANAPGKKRLVRNRNHVIENSLVEVDLKSVFLRKETHKRESERQPFVPRQIQH